MKRDAGLLDIEKAKPLHGHVLVKFDVRPKERKSVGGVLWLPPQSQEENHFRVGEVVSLGDGIPTKKGLSPHTLKVGDRVVVDSNMGTVVHQGLVHGFEYRLVGVYPYCQIEGVLEDDAELGT